jgi:hypothetical protein
MHFVERLSNVKPTLYSWYKSHSVFLYMVAFNFVENFAFLFVRDTGLQLSFLVMSLSGFGLGVMLASMNKMLRIPSFSVFGRLCIEFLLFPH